jgi:hypothetical protein
MRKIFSATRQTHELSILCRPRIKDRMFCVGCDAPVRWLLPEEAMALSRTSLRDVFRDIEANRLHCVETPEGFLLVCAVSLDQKVKASGEIRNEIENRLIAA